jgi:hypothetical protein
MSEQSPGKTRITIGLHDQDLYFERTLEAAIVVNWADLMRGNESGLVHLEYGVVPDGKLDYLQIWSSIRRGYWLLACSYWMSASQSHGAGVCFDNGYESESLAHILEVVMQHQNLFGLPQNRDGHGLLQLVKPTEKESKAAADWIKETVDRVRSLAEPTAKSVA